LTESSDIIIIDVSGSNIETFQIINIYNEKSLDSESDSTDYTVERSLQHIQITKETLIAGDFNAHHSWWNSSISNSVRADSLISWLNLYNCELINEPDVSTFTRKFRNSTISSVIDLAFATQNLFSQIFDWHVDENNASGSDHEIIKFNIRTKATELIENPLHSEFFNVKKADWKLFSEKLLIEAHNIDFSHLLYSDQPVFSQLNELNTAALALQNIIYAAAEKSIPKRRISENSKLWWSEKLTNLREKFTNSRRYWKRS
jgi:hypothetical protein